MTGGYVTVPRLDRDLLGDENRTTESHRGAWLWLYDQAAWKDRIDRFGRFTVRLRRGEIAASYRFLARAWGWSHGRVQRWLQLLADRGKITLRVEGGVVVIALGGYHSRNSESNPESQKPKQRAVEMPVDDREPSPSRKEESQKVDIDSKSGPVRRFAARSVQTTAQIRERWIAKLGRYAAARGFVGEYWTRLMGEKVDADRYLEQVNAAMRRERWDDGVDPVARAAEDARRRRSSIAYSNRKDHVVCP